VIDFPCPQCGHPLSASEDKAGANATCPGCGAVVAIPGTAPVAGSVPVTDVPVTSLTSDERTWGMLCHLSGLIALLLTSGFLSFLGPLIVWLVKKDTSAWVNYHGKEALNFHVNVLLYTVIAVAITAVTCGALFPVLFIPPIYAIVMSILGTIAAGSALRSLSTGTAIRRTTCRGSVR
jgi:uncharacterized Tic20 family protein